MLEKGGASSPAVWVAQGVWLSSRAPFRVSCPPVARGLGYESRAASGTGGWRRGQLAARAASGAGGWRHRGPLAFRAYKGSERFSCIRRQLMASFRDLCCLEVHEKRIAASNCTKSAGVIGSRSRHGRRGCRAVATPRLACRPMPCGRGIRFLQTAPTSDWCLSLN